MDINLQSDILLTLSDACRRFPHRPSPATLWRWRVKGVHGVRLECVRVGSRWCTTQQAVERFLMHQTEAVMARHCQEPEPSPDRDPAQERRLRQAGLLQPRAKPFQP